MYAQYDAVNLDKSKILSSWGKQHWSKCMMALCSHALPSSALGELGERARAQLASKITLCSTRCLHVQPSGGKGQGPCNVTLWCQKNQGCSGNGEKHVLWKSYTTQSSAVVMFQCHFSTLSIFLCSLSITGQKKNHFTCRLLQRMFCSAFKFMACKTWNSIYDWKRMEFFV